MAHKLVYWTSTTLPNQWNISLAATEAGLCYLGLPHDSAQALEEWVTEHLPLYQGVEDDAPLAPYIAELSEYFSGIRHTFSLPLDLHGTTFQLAVWQELLRIPYGETRSYQDIAVEIGRPQATRAVGGANGANPVPIIVPCHRVIGKNGTLTGYSGGLDVKTTLLQLEGLLMV